LIGALEALEGDRSDAASRLVASLADLLA